MKVTADEMSTMIREITGGRSPSQSSLPMTDERRAVWRDLKKEIDAFKRQGHQIRMYE